jgi:hypothetical protein
MNSATDFARVRVLPVILALAATSVVGCTRPGKTTAIGSGVGGAVGAGVGAIVGSQSGNAGVGVAIGAAAGAATGALIGNAFQAQEERNLAQDEIIKRQERSLQAQKNEIAELRTIRGDTGPTYNAALDSQVRYRYRPTSMSADSPEVARQRARLQQRGPLPAGSSAAQRAAVYSAPRYQPQPSRVEPAKRAASTGTLARYDVRSELSTKSAPVAVTEAVPAKPQAAPVAAKGRTPAILPVDDADNSSQSVMESDLPIAKTEAAVVPAPAPAATKECKEALTERDRAAEATENSDKLYHLRRALRLCPNSAPLHHELGKVYASMDRRSDAENEFKAALGIDPNLAASKKALGDLLKEEVQF